MLAAAFAVLLRTYLALDGMRVTSKAVPPYWYTCHMFPRRLRIFVPTMCLPLRYILPPYGLRMGGYPGTYNIGIPTLLQAYSLVHFTTLLTYLSIYSYVLMLLLVY